MSPARDRNPADDRVVAIVPLKALDRAKTRLGSWLDAGARRALVEVMLDRVLTACADASTVGDIVVVAGDRDGEALARARGAVVLPETPASAPGKRAGLDAALRAAGTALAEAPATLVVAADLPLLVGADLEAVCAMGRRRPSVVVAPTTDGGTGALLRRPPRAIGTAYGPGSGRAHGILAARAGIPARFVRRPGLALDVDTPADLRDAADGNDRLVPFLPRTAVVPRTHTMG